MKKLKSLVFLVFLMGVGVLLERASIALYERGSKVDWEVVKKALLENQNKKDFVATTATAGEAKATHSATTIALEDRKAADAFTTPDRSFRHGTPSSQLSLGWKTHNDARLGTLAPLDSSRRPSYSKSFLAVDEPTPAPSRMIPTLAIRPAPVDTRTAPSEVKTDEGAVPFPTPSLAIGPVLSSEPTAAIIPHASSQGTVVVPGPIVTQELRPIATPALVTKPVTQPADSAVPMIPVPEPVRPVISDKQDDGDQLRIVCHLNSVPAATLANVLNSSFHHGGPLGDPTKVVIVAESVSNSLLVSGPKSEVEKVQQMVEELDRPAAMVRLEVRIIEVDSANVKKSEEAASEKAADDGVKGDLHAVSALEKGTPLVWAEVTTLDNQTAQLTMGRQESRITGVSRSPGGVVNSIDTISVGTKIGLTPRVCGDNSVAIALDINDSRTGPLEEGAVITESKDGNPVRVPNTETLTMQTTVQLEDRKTVVLGGMDRDGKSGKDRLISVTAHILRAGEVKAAQGEEEEK